MAESTPNLNQAPLLSLVGYAAVSYLWADAMPRGVVVADGRVVGTITPRAGEAWAPLPLSQNTIKLTETPKESRHGSTYQVKLQGERTQAPAHVLAAVATMERRPVVLLVRQHDGQLRLVGSAEEPLRLLTTGLGQHPGVRAGLDLLFTGMTTRLAPFYAGALALDASSAGTSDVAVGVRVLDGHGQVRLTVPPGHDLVVEGPFRTDLTIQPR